MHKRFALFLAGLTLPLLGLQIRPSPTQVQITAGGYHTLALGSDGRLWAWGFNGQGQLGDGTAVNRPVPSASHPPMGAKIKSLAAGEDHSLFLTEGGRIFACGRNDHGQLGIGTTSNTATWIEVEGLDHVIQVVGGQHHSFALREDGTVWAWGDNHHSQISNLATPMMLAPIQITGLRNIREIASGTTHGLALSSSGVVWGWGDGREGQLGPRMQGGRFSPKIIHLRGPITHITAGGGFSLALKRDGTVFAWGRNSHGQLGNGTQKSSPFPSLVSGLENITLLRAGHDHGIAEDRNGRVWSWGDNNLGQLGNSTPSYAIDPRPLSLPEGKQADFSWHLAVGGYHTVLYQSGSAIYAVGYNHDSQLGDGTGEDRRTPVRLPKAIP